SEHCCVPLCSASAKFNGILSFHGFPTHSDLRRQWLVNIRRDHFTITSHTRVCCRHFASDQLIEPTTLRGRRRLIKGAVPTLFEWNGYNTTTAQSLSRLHWTYLHQLQKTCPKTWRLGRKYRSYVSSENLGYSGLLAPTLTSDSI
uniref:THAP domain-containing protein 1 n=1 Tax=Pundamilia nyererei TaxID=303518 RepID=A0A3B4FMM1_9CICH